MRSYEAILGTRGGGSEANGEISRAQAAPKVPELGQDLRPADQWSSPESLSSEQRFGQAHAKLFLFIGHKVRTPGGPGTLIQVFAERVTVLLDADIEKCSWFATDEISPVMRD